MILAKIREKLELSLRVVREEHARYQHARYQNESLSPESQKKYDAAYKAWVDAEKEYADAKWACEWESPPKGTEKYKLKPSTEVIAKKTTRIDRNGDEKLYYIVSWHIPGEKIFTEAYPEGLFLTKFEAQGGEEPTP